MYIQLIYVNGRMYLISIKHVCFVVYLVIRYEEYLGEWKLGQQSESMI